MRIHLNFSHAANYLRENIFSSLSEQNKKIMTYVSAVFIFLAAFFLTYRYCKKTTLPFKAAEQDPQQPSISVSNKENSNANLPTIVQPTTNSQKKVEIGPLKNVKTADGPKQFNQYTLDLVFSDYALNKKKIEVNAPGDIKPLLKIIEDQLILDPLAQVRINFYSPSSVEEMTTRIEMYQQSSSILQFELTKGDENSITAKVKVLNSSTTGNSQSREYANGIKEVFNWKNNEGYRIFADGVRIFGKFDYTNHEFIQRYRIEKDGKIKFIQPIELIHYTDKSSDPYRYYSISECEGKLIVLEEIFKNDGNTSHYEKVEKPLLEVLWWSVKNTNKIPDAIKLKKMLTHPLFKTDLPTFIQESLKIEEGVPVLFTLPVQAATEIVDVAAKEKSIDPLKIIDQSGKNLFIHAAEKAKKFLGHTLLSKLIEHFPAEFGKIRQQPQIKECLAQFIDSLLYLNDNGIPNLFELPTMTALEILRTAIEEKITVKFFSDEVQLFSYAVNQENPQFLQKLILLFPSLFDLKDPAIIRKCILNATPIAKVEKLIAVVKEMGGQVTYHALWLHLAEGKKPDQKFLEQFASLSLEEKIFLKLVASKYKNPFVDDLKV